MTSDSRLSRLRHSRLTAGGLLVAATMVVILVVLARRAGDPDIWWHLRTGQWILQHHALPSTDLFSYTVPTHAWTNHEYGTEVMIALLYGWGGFALVSLAFAAIIWAGFLLILARIRMDRVPTLITALALGLAALAGEAVWGPRPQMITFTLTCLELYWLEGFLRGRSRMLFALPLVVAAWANLHGGFAISLLFLVLAVATQAVLALAGRTAAKTRTRTIQLLVIIAACVLAAAANVHGFDVYAYGWTTQTNSFQQSFIAEWLSPNFHDLGARGLEAMILLLIVGAAISRPRLWDLVLVVTATLLALSAVRHVVLFVAMVTPVLASSYGAAWREWATPERLARLPRLRDARSAVALWLVGLLVATIGTAAFVDRTLAHQSQATADNFPVGAADWLAAHPTVGTHMLNASDWGGYLAYRFYPTANRRVFIYGEYLVMGAALVQNIYDIEHAVPDWQSILARYDVDYVVERPNSPLSEALSVDAGWRKVYDDGFAVIFVH